MFLKISQTSRENTRAGVFFLIKLQDSGKYLRHFEEHLQTTASKKLLQFILKNVFAIYLLHLFRFGHIWFENIAQK